MSWVFCSMISKMGQNSLWNLGFMAELWGKNSATDNPPRPMILIPAHTPSSHAFPLTPSHT